MIYIAAPYSHPDESVQASRAEAVAVHIANLLHTGVLAISPVLAARPVAKVANLAEDWETWRQFCFALLRRCVALHVLWWDEDVLFASRGVQEEIRYATELGIPIVKIKINGEGLC